MPDSAVHTNATRTLYGSFLFSAAYFSHTYWPSPGRKM